MAGARAADLDLVDTADQLQRAGFCVYHLVGGPFWGSGWGGLVR